MAAEYAATNMNGLTGTKHKHLQLKRTLTVGIIKVRLSVSTVNIGSRPPKRWTSQCSCPAGDSGAEQGCQTKKPVSLTVISGRMSGNSSIITGQTLRNLLSELTLLDLTSAHKWGFVWQPVVFVWVLLLKSAAKKYSSFKVIQPEIMDQEAKWRAIFISR